MIRIPSPNIGLTKSYPLLFILSVRQLHRFHLPRNQSKTRRSIPVYLHFHIPGPDNDPSVYSQYPPLAGAILIGAITTHRMQYPPIDRWNQNPPACPQIREHRIVTGEPYLLQQDKAGVCQYMRVAFFVHRVDGVLCEDVRWQSAFPMPPHGRWRLLL